jgi:E3 ubiquitin-protein ligase TRIP12
VLQNSEETDEEEDDIEDDDDDDDLDDDDDDDDDDAMEDAEMEDALAMAAVASKSGKHVLEFCIGDHVVPYNLTIYQAVKQFGRTTSETSEVDAEMDKPLAENTIWKQTQVLWFRPVSSANHSKHEDMQTSEKTKPDKTSKAASNPAAEQVVIADNVSMNRLHVLKSCLVSALPSSVTVNDPALDVLALLRILHSLNSDWTSVFEAAASSNTPLAVSRQEFISNKLTAKANRQLQDPIIVMTGHLPQWLTQIASVCPFLLPFENRLLLFCATSLDRDRAVQRIQDLTMREPTAMDNNEQRQLGNRLERKKKIICRDDLLKHAETAINELIGSRAMLEIQYENEVGSGLGPTLEFYALVSQDLQRADLELWRGEKRALPSQVKGLDEFLLPLPITGFF